MPELPEVEVVRAGLEPAVRGALVTGVDIFDQRSLRRHDPARGDFVRVLTGQRLSTVVRRGKFLWLRLADVSSWALLIHLGMSGQVLLRDAGAPLEADGPVRIRLSLDLPGHGELAVHFVDQRIFGSMALDRLVATTDGFPGGCGDDAAQVPGQVAHIGRDPLDPAFSDARFFDSLARKNTGIKRALLDQTLISGIGNIYADEALWAAKVHYAQSAATLGRFRARRLLTEVRLVLAKALAEGGTSFDAQYVNVNGASGYFSHSLNAYGRAGEPCPRCGRPLVREAFMNRSSHLCPHCQRVRVPRAGGQTQGRA